MKFFKYLAAALALLIVAGLGFVYAIGAWHIVFPSSSHDTVFSGLPGANTQPLILVFSKTNRFRHRDGIRGGQVALAEISRSNGWAVFETENGAVFNRDDLQNVEAVVFLNATGDMLSREQQHAFQDWLEQGGGWLGIHAAGDGSHAEWDWYMEHLIGAEFIAHIMGPQFQEATVVTENPDHPVNHGLPAQWQHNEEWYSWKNSPRDRGFKVLATVDETSYTPVQKFMNSEVDLRMGDHPVVWYNCVARGRAVYSAMGHSAEAFESVHYRRLLESSLNWLLQAPAGTAGVDYDC